MSVRITDLCINCDACLDECPTESIVDNDDNPTGEDLYYVNPATCTECIGDHDTPACQEACPTEGCIVWDLPFTDDTRDHYASDVYKFEEEDHKENTMPFHDDISMDDRKSGDSEAEIA